ncbi:RICIN domain-containing protein [Streptomyces sp. NPDC052012]|uniref:RICIN domain-containing protein n=1 Tax=Streptomyces sp. NPDC052012 TaxID=3155051 RepID=UPI00344F351C
MLIEFSTQDQQSPGKGYVMRATQMRNAGAAILAVALLAVASPAVAGTPSPQNSEPSSPLLAGAARLQNLKSGKYLQAVSTANGAAVVQQPYEGTGLQTWETWTFDGYFTFENFSAGRNLGIDGASTASGAGAIIANGSSDLNQDWDREFLNGDYFRLINRKSGKCLGISGASTANGARAAQFPCDGSANQSWRSLS